MATVSPEAPRTPEQTAPQAEARNSAKSRTVTYRDYVDTQLRRTSNQVKWVEIMGAVITLAAAVLGTLLVVALFDHWIYPLGTFLRWTILIGLVAGAGAYTVLRIVPLFVRRINTVYAAATIEEHSPSLKNSLVNLLMLRGSREGVSRAVLKAVESQAANGLTHVPVEAAVDRSRIIKLGYVLLGIFVVLAAYALFSPKSTLATVQRIAAPWADIDAPTRVIISEVTPGNTSVFAKEFVDVEALIDGVDDDEPVTLFYSTSDRRSVDRPITMNRPDGSLRHQASLPQGTDGLQEGIEYTYYVAAGDARSQTFTVTVNAPPRIAVTNVQYEFAPYTRRSSYEQPDHAGIAALEGTKVTLTAEANQEIDKAYVDFNCDGRFDKAMQVDGNIATATFNLPYLKKDGRAIAPPFNSYQITFTNKNGDTNARPIRNNVDIIPDLSPQVNIQSPREAVTQVPVNGSTRIDVVAADQDFALSSVVVQAERNDVAGALVFEEVLLSQERRDEFKSGFVFRPEKYNLQPGDVIRYWAIARDNRHENSELSPNVSKSATDTREPRRIEIVAAAVNPNQQNDPQNNQQQDDNQNNKDQQNQGQKDQDDKGDGGQQGDQKDAGDQGDKSQGGDQGDQSDDSGQQGGGSGGDQGSEGSQQQGGEQNSGGTAEGQQGESQQGNEQNQNNSGEGQEGQQSNQSNPFDKLQEKAQQAQQNEQQKGSGGEQNSADQQQKQDGANGQQNQQNAGQTGSDEQQKTDAEQNAAGGNAGQTGQQSGSDQAQNQQAKDAGGDNANSGDKSAQPDKANTGNSAEQKNNTSANSDNAGADANKDAQQQGVKQDGDQTGDQRKDAGAGSQGDKQDTEQKDGQQAEKTGGSGSPKENAAAGQKGTGGDNQKDTSTAGDPEQGEKKNTDSGEAKEDKNAKQGDEEAGADTSQAGDRAGEGGKSKEGAEKGEADKPKEQKDGAKSEAGGNPDDVRGAPGGGEDNNKDGKGSPQQYEEQKVKNEKDKDNGGEKPLEKNEAPAGSTSKKESNSKGGADGDRSGGGGKGGGQQADSAGTGGGGSNTAADEGANAAGSQGTGETGDKAGQDVKSEDKTGESGDEKGNGSASRQGDEQRGDGTKSDGAKQGDQNSQDNQAPPKEGQAKQEGESKPGEQNSEQSQDLGSQDSQGSGQPGTGGTRGVRQESREAGPEPGGSDPDLDAAKKATDLILANKDALLENYESDADLQQLFPEKDALRQYLQNLEQQRQQAELGGEQGEIARNALRNLQSRQLKGETESDDLSGVIQGASSKPPAEYADQVRAFNRVNRRRGGK